MYTFTRKLNCFVFYIQSTPEQGQGSLQICRSDNLRAWIWIFCLYFLDQTLLACTFCFLIRILTGSPESYCFQIVEYFRAYVKLYTQWLTFNKCKWKEAADQHIQKGYLCQRLLMMYRSPKTHAQICAFAFSEMWVKIIVWAVFNGVLIDLKKKKETAAHKFPAQNFQRKHQESTECCQINTRKFI